MSSKDKGKQSSYDDGRYARILDAIDANIAVLNQEGTILITNKGWSDFAASNPSSDGSLPQHVGLRHEMLIQQICAAALKNLKRTCSGLADQLLHIWTAAYPGQYGIQPQTILVGIVRQADRKSVKHYQRCQNLKSSHFEAGLCGASQ